MTVDQPEQLQIWKWYVMTKTLKRLFLCNFCVHVSATSVTKFASEQLYMYNETVC